MDRRIARDEYKKRKSAPGIYAIKCAATGETWVGAAPDLATINNRLRFTLEQGLHPHRGLQEAWSKLGAGSFTFEELERLSDDDELPYLRRAALKDRLAHWVAALDATPV
jgi:hypothetical protein